MNRLGSTTSPVINAHHLSVRAKPENVRLYVGPRLGQHGNPLNSETSIVQRIRDLFEYVLYKFTHYLLIYLLIIDRFVLRAVV